MGDDNTRETFICENCTLILSFKRGVFHTGHYDSEARFFIECPMCKGHMFEDRLEETT